MKPIFTAAEQRSNLVSLTNFLAKRVRPSKFDMGVFKDHRPRCGTVACALGWAVHVPALKRRGISDATPKSLDFTPAVKGVEYDEWEFADVVFGDNLYDMLFTSLLAPLTPKQWAAKARAYLKETA